MTGSRSYNRGVRAPASGSLRVAPARQLAFDVLLAVEEGGFASDLLRERSAGLDSRDASLASEIVLGVLRYQLQLDFLRDHFAGRALEVAPQVNLALRMGIYQLRYLDRIPPHAAVGESVALVRRAGCGKAAGLVNAVLRKVHRRPVRWPNRAVEWSHPEWLLERWTRHFGAELALGIARVNLARPETYVRYAGQPPPGLEPAGIAGGYRCLGEPPAGARVQDLGSQSIVPLLDLRPGQWFLDLCAAPGNKTAQAREAGVWAVACDLRLRRLREVDCPDRVLVDGTQPLPFSRCFDRVLVDAPCSGTGTLGRNPEIKWRLRPADLAGFSQRQAALLTRAREVVKPGGLIVYSTCSLESEENEEVAGALAVRQGYRIPGREPGDGFYAAVVQSG